VKLIMTNGEIVKDPPAAKTSSAYADICSAAARGDLHITPYCLVRSYGARTTAAAFELAVKHVVIEEAYVSTAGLMASLTAEGIAQGSGGDPARYRQARHASLLPAVVRRDGARCARPH